MLPLNVLSNFLDDYLNCKDIKDFCINGLQFEGKERVRSVAFAVSASLNVIQKAKDFGADALIVHHGLFWDRDSHAISGVKKEKLKTLMESDMSLMAYHLPLDCHQEVGNNWKVAKDMQWENLQGFSSVGKIPLGVRGSFKALPKQEFFDKMAAYYGQKPHLAEGGADTISSTSRVSDLISCKLSMLPSKIRCPW